MPPPTKKRRLTPPGKANDPEDVEMADNDASSDEDDSRANSRSSTPSTEAEIAEAQRPTKSKKTMKRKHRATSPSLFGQTLETLLHDPVTGPSTAAPIASTSTSTAIQREDAQKHLLSLKPGIHKRRKEENLDKKARKVVEGERREHEEVGRVKDVIGGWGGESEKALRKIAQRGGTSISSYPRAYAVSTTASMARYCKATLPDDYGLTRLFSVVQLFNAIQAAQSASQSSEVQKTQLKGTGKPRLLAPDPNTTFRHGQIVQQKGKGKDNAVGRGKDG